MYSIQPDQVMAIEPGSFALERRRHAQFAADRAVETPGTEWFHPSPALLAHLAAVAEKWPAGWAPSRMVSTQQAARTLGLHPRTVWRRVKAGKLAPDLYTPGGQMRWDVDRLRAELAR
jgi:hypothetical protein